MQFEMMTKEEMVIVLIGVVIGLPLIGEIVTREDHQVLTEERGLVLIMVVGPALAPIGERGIALIMVVGKAQGLNPETDAAQVLIKERGLAPIMDVV